MTIDHAGQLDEGRVWRCQECRDATIEMIMLLDEGGRSDLAGKLRSAMVGPRDALVVWDMSPGTAIEPVIKKALTLYREKTWPEEADDVQADDRRRSPHTATDSPGRRAYRAP